MVQGSAQKAFPLRLFDVPMRRGSKEAEEDAMMMMTEVIVVTYHKAGHIEVLSL